LIAAIPSSPATVPLDDADLRGAPMPAAELRIAGRNFN
jgi:hypothetical protein